MKIRADVLHGFPMYALRRVTLPRDSYYCIGNVRPHLAFEPHHTVPTTLQKGQPLAAASGSDLFHFTSGEEGMLLPEPQPCSTISRSVKVCYEPMNHAYVFPRTLEAIVPSQSSRNVFNGYKRVLFNIWPVTRALATNLENVINVNYCLE